MAVFMGSDASLTLNSVDLSDHVRSITISEDIPELDKTAMGASLQNFLAGLPKATMTVEWNQDYAASEIDVTLQPLVGAAEFAYLAKPVATTVSATNPSYSGNCILTSYSPIDQTVGDLATVTTSFTLNSITRGTT
jgi:hypothetical protein